MLLVAACHTYEEPVPLTVEKDWDFGEHPLIARLASDEERVLSPASMFDLVASPHRQLSIPRPSAHR